MAFPGETRRVRVYIIYSTDTTEIESLPTLKPYVPYVFRICSLPGPPYSSPFNHVSDEVAGHRRDGKARGHQNAFCCASASSVSASESPVSPQGQILPASWPRCQPREHSRTSDSRTDTLNCCFVSRKFCQLELLDRRGNTNWRLMNGPFVDPPCWGCTQVNRGEPREGRAHTLKMETD